jgi:hypothetical protein
VAFHESSFGPFYFTRGYTKEMAPVKICSIAEYEKPWRVGKAIAIPWDASVVMVIGLWFPSFRIWKNVLLHRVPSYIDEDDLWMVGDASFTGEEPFGSVSPQQLAEMAGFKLAKRVNAPVIEEDEEVSGTEPAKDGSEVEAPR